MEFLTLNPILCVGWLIIGAVAGAIARSMMKSSSAPLVQDIILGLAGSVIGGFVAGLLGLAPSASAAGIERVIINLVIAIVGAVILLFIGKNILRR